MKKLLIVMFLAAMFSNCQNDIEDVPFSEYSLEGTPASWVNVNYFDGSYKVVTINSNNELKIYVEGDYPPIDFTKKTLVLAYGCHSGTAFGLDIKFQHVSGRDYVMTASGMATAAAAMFDWKFAIVVDKLPHNSKIQLNLNIINKATES
ncbi:MAG: hypothetical protein LBV32_01870 [Tannerellaceae bacterium]|jgi:hypothetical protein|nr:hypothetical protein [Tannerellaceae bacterium]